MSADVPMDDWMAAIHMCVSDGDTQQMDCQTTDVNTITKPNT